ncbi:MAG: DUF72 domain-containing protein [Dehalococcoidia bacterium]|nr:DUF72 domain-containing protein [Chloroflexota bacterium]MCK4221520.1 DUF72 domain-containing protein [Dehalococcoidia bacterium]MCK4580244.1 DUF72 domain-containing protein [Dehalococcoidia bacterium]
MSEIRVGTCSWTDPSLLECGRFYPHSADSAEARLRYYSSQFDLVEVDSTYYAMPAERVSYLWTQRVPEEFIFDVKAFRLFTQHPTPVSSLPVDIRQALPAGLRTNSVYYRDLPDELTNELWERFDSALLPLDTVGKLGVVLFQFPPWFQPGSQQFSYMAMCQSRLPQYRLAIELRSGLWFAGNDRGKLFDFLRQRDLPFVCVDEPQGFGSSVPPVAEASSDIGLVRFHGRNTENWEKKGITAVERFNYLYQEHELKPWADRIKGLAKETKEMHVLFNNCHQDKAVVNARQMSLMLRSQNGLRRE